MKLSRRSLLSSSLSLVAAKSGNAVDLRAVADGLADATQVLNDAAVTVPAGGVLQLPAGRYRLTAPVLLKSETTITGQGATLFADAEWRLPRQRDRQSPVPRYSLLANEHFGEAGIVDHDISVRNLSFEYTRTRGDAHAISFRRVRGLSVRDCTFAGGGDATAFLACERTEVIRCASKGTINCAYDHWEGPIGAVVSDCVAICGAGYGIMFTATTTSGHDGVGSDCAVTRNRIEGSTTAAIWVASYSQRSSIRGLKLAQNTAVVAAGSGIGATGAVQAIEISGNTVQGTRGGPAIFVRPDGWNRPDTTRITGNQIIDCEVSDGNQAVIQALGEKVTVRNNRARGGSYPALIWVDGADRSIEDNEGTISARPLNVTKPSLGR